MSERLQQTSISWGNPISIYHCKVEISGHYILRVCTSWKWRGIDGVVSLFYIVWAFFFSVKFTAVPRNCNMTDSQSWSSYELNIRARPWAIFTALSLPAWWTRSEHMGGAHEAVVDMNAGEWRIYETRREKERGNELRVTKKKNERTEQKISEEVNKTAQWGAS